MEIKLLAVLLTIINQSNKKMYITQKDICNEISKKYLVKFDRKSIGSAISTLEIVFKDDIENILGYKIIRGPQNKGITTVKLNIDH